MRTPLDQLGGETRTQLHDGRTVTIGPLASRHADDLFVIFAETITAGGGYPHTPPLTRSVFDDVWVRPVTLAVGAVVEGRLAGAYYLKPNGPGLGAHIANAGYVVASTQRGGGIGAALVADSIERAPLAGFDAVQFNFVFESNPARALYERMGWQVIGRIPGAVGTGDGASEDAMIYWRAVGRQQRLDEGRDE